MEIIFCDVCNESVPQADLDQGLAVHHKGRVICSRCEAAMSPDAARSLEERALAGEVEPAGSSADETTVVETLPIPARTLTGRPVARGLGAGTAVACVALVLSAAGVAFLWDRIESQGRSFERVARSQELARAEVLAMEERLASSMAAMAASVEKTSATLQGLGTRIDELGGREQQGNDSLREDLAGLARRTQELEEVLSAIDHQELELARLSTAAVGLQEQFRRLTERVDQAEATAREVTPEVRAPAPTEPAWRVFVADLKSANSGVRWQAVQSLGGSRDPAVAEVLAPMLQDADIFVRMATARVLGDLGARSAIPALIDALEDSEASVREAADVALRAITGQDFQFDPGAKDAERQKRVKAWRDWWKKASEEARIGAVRSSTSYADG